MLRSLQMARTSMQIEQARIDVLANNLANVATSGFRQVLTRVTEEGATTAADAPPGGRPSAFDLRASRDLNVSHATDTRSGDISATGRNSDVALLSRGFFVVQDPEGGEFYTRDGSFYLDDNGRLVTAGGQQVLGTGGPVEVGGGTLEIQNDGVVLVDGAARGRLRVVDFGDPSLLLHRGDSLLAAPADQTATDVPATEVSVLQGHLEGSNVDAVRTLVDMIAAQRAFEVQSKMLQAADESLQKSVNNLSAVRG
ncbi:MAG: flagellar hook-basal body protein [Candidatus Krumholzibacteriia bacterium]